MKRVTLAISDEVAKWACRRSARRNIAVSTLVEELLAEEMRHDKACQLAMEKALTFPDVLFEGPFLTRGELYAERFERKT